MPTAGESRGRKHTCGRDEWRWEPSRQNRRGERVGGWVCAPCKSEYAVRLRRKLIDDAFVAYGNRCAACGLTDRDVLTFDHVNNDGAKHRKEIGRSASALARWCKRNGYPDSIQILCANCQLRKQRRAWRGTDSEDFVSEIW